MDENRKKLNKRILDPDYKATMLKERSRQIWKRRKAKSAGESEISKCLISYLLSRPRDN